MSKDGENDSLHRTLDRLVEQGGYQNRSDALDALLGAVAQQTGAAEVKVPPASAPQGPKGGTGGQVIIPLELPKQGFAD
ncbi:hypothetical protein JJJ17_05285 [Paracoccus caeni]|uniref:Uncharacterized protein n=1 Tax=Paracoccus caeni TaxID=657651 RepID=A0A934SDG3_9RHOB|nr:ribbon-helix-helix domain-containing protein [Paracoccus caeni]MBK4215335.1 hypothetical protein [Paracoccus caeni]